MKMKANKKKFVKATARIGGLLERRVSKGIASPFYAALGVLDKGVGEFRLGNMHYLQGDFENAVPHLQHAIQNGEVGMEVVRRLSISLRKKGQDDKALSTVFDALERHSYSPSDVSVLLSTLSGLENKKKYRESLPALAERTGGKVVSKLPWQKIQELSKLEPTKQTDADWLYNYASILEDCGRFDEAATNFTKASRLSSESSWWAYRAGLANELNGDVKQAETHYSLAIANDKKFNSSDLGIGPFHRERGYWDLAALAFEAKLENCSSSARPQLLLDAARANSHIFELSEAIRLYSDYLKERPRDAKAYLEYANVLEMAGEFEVALDTVRVAYSVAPTALPKKEGNWLFGRIFWQLGRFEEAANEFLTALSEDLDENEISPNGRENVHDLNSKNLLPGNRVKQDIKSPFIVEQLAELGMLSKDSSLGWAKVARAYGMFELESKFLKIFETLTALLPKNEAARLVQMEIEKKQFEQACYYALETRYLFRARVKNQATPKKNSYDHQLMMYAEWRDHFPIRENVIVYESNLAISVDCNPLAICERLLEKEPGRFLHVWSVESDSVPVPRKLRESRDVIVVIKDSYEYTKLLATAEYLVNNSTFPTYFSRREDQKYLMTWHGTPLKTLCKDQPMPLTHANMARNYMQASHAIFANDHTRRVLLEHADIADLVSADLLMTGSPRNDRLVRHSGKTLNERPIAMYAPTWREDSEMEEQARNLVAVQEALTKEGYQVLLRAHHYVEQRAKEINGELEFLSRSVSTYEAMEKVDLLVTDFSSIYFDFAVTKRPILFFIPDWERYADSRGVYFEQCDLPGPVCETIEQLRSELENHGVDETARNAFLNEFAPFEDGGATDRVIYEFFGVGEGKNSAKYIGPRANSVVVFRQSFIPNGMASSFKNLCANLAETNTTVVAITQAEELKKDVGRQQTLSELHDEVRVIGRTGKMVKDSREFHASFIDRKRKGPRSELYEEIYRSMFVREAQRIFPVNEIRAAIEFDGYSQFMADLVLEIGDESTVKGIYLHNDLVAEAKLRMPELWKVIRNLERFDKVVAVSEGLMKLCDRKFQAECGISLQNLGYIENSIIPKKIREMSKLDVELDWSSTDYFVHVGRFSPEKNQVFLIELFSEVLAEYPTAKLLFLGDGPTRELLEAKVNELGIADNVAFLGWVNNPYPYIANSQALLLPSLHEGQPMVILEANTLERVAICSDIPAVRGMEHLAGNIVLPLQKDEWVKQLKGVLQKDYVDPRFDADAYKDSALEMFKAEFGLKG